jgi:hypothetical protein
MGKSEPFKVKGMQTAFKVKGMQTAFKVKGMQTAKPSLDPVGIRPRVRGRGSPVFALMFALIFAFWRDKATVANGNVGRDGNVELAQNLKPYMQSSTFT